MIRKVLTFSVLSVLGCAVVDAQETPSAPKDKVERKAQIAFSTAPFTRSYLGVQTQEISKENFSRFGLSAVRGVGIEKVVENSPAARAGLQANDVIIRFDGEEVESISKLNRLISEVAPDHNAKLTILRGGSEREINVVMGKREFAQFEGQGLRFENFPALPQIQALPNIQALPRTMQTVPIPPMRGGDSDVFVWRGDASRQIGVGVTALTKQLSDYFGVSEGSGLLINSVRENSPAARAGLKAGDIIVEADGTDVKGQIDLIRAINAKKEGDISLTIVRDRNRQNIRVTPETSKDGAFKFDGFENFFEAAPGELNFQTKAPKSPAEPLSPALLRIASPIF